LAISGIREAHREKMAAQVDVVHCLELLGGRIEQRAIDRDADVIDEQIELAEPAHCLLDGMTAVVFFAHIALDRVGGPLLGANSRGGLARERGIEVRDHHRGALASTEDRSCTAVAD